MIFCPNWQHHYQEMLELLHREIDMTKVQDVSVGSFRIAKDYLKKMRKNAPDSPVVQFPFQNDGGVAHYPTELMEGMEQFLMERLSKWVSPERIFQWKSM